MPHLDRAALRRGLAVGLVVVAPAALLAALVVDPDEPTSTTALVLLAVVLVGFGAGGAAAGRRVDGTPMIHGAVVGLVTHVVTQSGLLVVRPMLDRSGELRPGAIVVAAFLATTIGTVGGAVGGRRRVHDRRTGGDGRGMMRP